jgi:hypothetical protein
MAIDARHPSYVAQREDWQLCRDCHAGERTVKAQGTKYLPATSGMVFDGMASVTEPGFQAYDAYRKRAAFPDYVSEGVGHMLGLMHAKEAKIELPKELEYLRERASSQGEGLQDLLARINEEQLLVGRLGLLLDFPEAKTTGPPRLFISTYAAETVINWDSNLVEADRTVLNLVVLDESRYERREGLDWNWVERYRVLSLGPIAANDSSGVYGVGVSRESKDLPSELKTPSIKGKTLDKIPFVFVNTRDNLTEPDRPPLLGLSRLSMTIYRGEADYRQNLFMQGQDTFVTIGAPDSGDDAQRVGAGARIDLPTNGDAKYVGVNSQGLPEQRQALEKDHAMAAQRAGQLATAKSKQIESGEALQTRIASVSASLTTLAKSGAHALEQLLRIAAEWVGADPTKVKVEPNLQFQDLAFNTRDIVELASARSMGAPLSRKSFHDTLKERGFTRMTFEEEMAEIESEEPLNIVDGTTGDLPDDDTTPTGGGGASSKGSGGSPGA